jgi:hypothetical protein
MAILKLSRFSVADTALTMRSNLSRSAAQRRVRVGIASREVVAPSPLPFSISSAADHGDICAHGIRDSCAHVAKTAEPDDGDPLGSRVRRSNAAAASRA